MGVGQDHSELIPDRNASKHVSNGASNGPEDGVSLFLLQPHPKLDGGRFGLFAEILSDFNGDMFEAPGERTEFALNDDLAGLDVNSDTFWDFEFLLSYDVFHVCD
jgi:hypothetical protein